MSQCCPICKARLWTDAPLLTPGRLCCPRCGAVFRPTVPWVYFRILLLVVVMLALVVLSGFSRNGFWIAVFLLGVAVFFWFLPRFIDLQKISGDLPVTEEGPIPGRGLDLRLDREWKEKREEFDERARFRKLVYALIGVGLLLILLANLSVRF